MGVLSYLRGDDIKALRATPDVLEAMRDRTFSPHPLIASPQSQRRIDAVYVEAQNASYGWMYRYQPAVRQVVDYVAGNIAQLGLKVYERVADDAREHRGDHEAAVAIRQPNPHTPGNQFLFELVTDYLIFDNSYALKLRGADGRLILVRVKPPMIGLVGRSHFSIESYRIYRQDGTFFDVPPEDMIHWRGYNPDDPRKGESKLETLREELASDLAARKSVTELHRSGLRMPGWMERPLDAPEWTDEARRRFQEDWSAQAMTSKRKVPVAEEGMTYKQGGVSPEDAEYLASRRFTSEQVAAQYGLKGVPPASEEERKQFYADVLPPLCERFASFLDLQILQQEYGADDHYFEFGREKLIDEVYKTYTSASGRPVLITNEARAKLDLPPVDGGDELVTPANVIVGDNPKPSPGVMPIQDPNKPSQEGDHREEQAPLPPGRQASLPSDTKAQLLPRRAAQERRHREYVEEFEAPVKRFVNRMGQTLKSNGWNRKAIEDERYAKELASDLQKTAQAVVAREGGLWAARLGMADIDMSQVRNYLSTFSEEKAKEIAKALKDALRDAEKPAEVLNEAKNVATPRAATSMATAMSAFAVAEAGRQSPDADIRTKTWVVTSGNSAHPEMDGETVYLGEQFSNGSDGPPADHPGCECLLEIDGGGHPPAKSLEPRVKQAPQPINVNVTMPEVSVQPIFEIPEGAVHFKAGDVTVEPAAPEINVESPTVNVSPAQVNIEKGAVEAPVVNVEPAEAPQVKFEKGAIQTNVEAAPAPEVKIEDGAIEVNVNPADVNVQAAPAPSVNIEVKGGKTKKTVTFSDGETAEISEEEDA